MKKCPKCQAACPEDSKFCPACGTEAVEVSKESKAVVRAGQSRYCPNCGAECTTDTAFCPKCGTSLNAPTAALNAEPESCQENRPPEVNEWYFKNRPMLPPVRHTRIMSQGTMLSVERWKQFGFSYGKTNFRIDVKNITAIVLKQKVSVFSIMEPLNKSLRASAGSFSACRRQIPLDVAMLRLRGLFLDSRKNPSTDARIDLISVSLWN